MRSRRQMLPASSLRGGLAIAVACALALECSSRAFASAPVHQGPLGNPTGTALPRGCTRAHAGQQRTASNASWHFASCAAFLLVSGAQALWATRAQKLRVAPRKVVRVATAARAAAPREVMMPSMPHVVRAEAVGLSSSAASQVDKPIEADVVPAFVYDDHKQQLGSPLPVAPMHVLAGVGTECYASAASRSARRGGVARRVGASRCKSARRASSSAAGASPSASRRSVGAKLIPVAAPGVVAPSSFDASKVRTKIQVGLRSKSTARCASKRENKSSPSGVAASSGTRMYLEVSGFASIKTDENKDIIKIFAFHT